LRRELTAKAAGLQFISAAELKKEVESVASSESCYEESDSDIKDTRRPVAYRKVCFCRQLSKYFYIYWC